MSADLQRVIRIVFQGDNETQRAFAEITQSINVMDKAIMSVAGPLADVADKVLKLQTALIAMATGGIALAVNEAGKWNDSFNEISTLLDITGDDLERFKKAVLDYGASASFALDDVNRAIYTAISAGVEYSDVLELMTTAEKLAISGKAELGATTEVLVSTLNAYGASMDEAGHYSDILFTTVKEGQTTLPELATSLSKVTSLAAAAGIPFEEVAAAVAALTARGMETSESMTAVRGAIQAIIKPTSEAAQVAEDLGIEFNASALESKGLAGVLQDVYLATGGNVEEMAKLFTNVRGLTGVLALFGPDGGDLFLEKMQAMETSTGSTEEAFDKMAENMANAMQSLINSIKTTLISAGLPLLEDFGDGVEALSGIFDGLRVGLDSGAFDPLYAALTEALSRITDFLNEVGTALPEALDMVEWEKLLDGFQRLSTELGGIFDALFLGLDLTEPEDLAQVIQVLANAAGSLASVAAGIITEWRPIFELIGNLVTGFGNLDNAMAENAGNVLGTAQKYAKLREHFGPVTTALILLTAETTSSADSTSTLANAMGLLFNPSSRMMDLSVALAERLGLMGREAVAASLDIDTLVGTIVTMPDGKEIYITLEGVDAIRREAEKIGVDLEGLTEDQFIELYILANQRSIDDVRADIKQLMDSLAGDAQIPVEAIADVASFRMIDQHLLEIQQEVDIPVEVDKEKEAERRSAEIQKELEWDAKVEIANVERDMEQIKADAAIIQTEMEWQAKVDIAEIEAKAAIIQSKIEWDAKMDIAEVEANAKIMVALAESVGAAWTATGESLASAYQAYADADHQYKSTIEKWINEELRMRRELLELQQEMFLVQKNYMEAKTEALKRGDGMIQIDGAGLQPHLEAFMWEILSAIQVRVNEEGMDMLLGTGDLL